jgi:RNA polymerase sigma-70 factor (ECF subfamily)
MISEKEFSKLIGQHQNIIHKISLLYSNDPSDREDLFQEICLQLWRSYDGFQGQSKFSTWLYRVSLNTAISYMRKKANWLTFGLPVPEDRIPSERAEADEDSVMLTRAISKLNRIDRALILLWLEGETYSEIAQILGISESNVSVKLVRIKRRIKEIVSEG